MKKVNVSDPIHKALFDAEQPAKKAKTLPWRPMSRPMKCPHLWEATLLGTLQKGTHTIMIRATNPNGPGSDWSSYHSCRIETDWGCVSLVAAKVCPEADS